MSKIITNPYYRLRELIYNKYGEPKFAIGCEITARWVAFETGISTTTEHVQFWCNILAEEIENDNQPFQTFDHMKPSQLAALERLFGLKSPFEILNQNQP